MEVRPQEEMANPQGMKMFAVEGKGILFFYIEAQKRSRVTKLGAQTQLRVVLWFVPLSASKKCITYFTVVKIIVS